MATTKKIAPSFLLSSSHGYVKLLSGGRLFELSEKQDPQKHSDPVSEKALCMSVGQHGSYEKLFDYSVPEDQWTHIALSSKASTSVLSLFANGALVDTLSMRFNLPLTVLGSNTPAHMS